MNMSITCFSVVATKDSFPIPLGTFSASATQERVRFGTFFVVATVLRFQQTGGVGLKHNSVRFSRLCRQRRGRAYRGHALGFLPTHVWCSDGICSHNRFVYTSSPSRDILRINRPLTTPPLTASNKSIGKASHWPWEKIVDFNNANYRNVGRNSLPLALGRKWLILITGS